MNPEQFRQVESFFERACKLPADERVAFVEHHCNDDPLVLSKVLGMLRADSDDGDTILSSDFEGSLTLAPQDDEDLPEFERYNVIKRIGQGGMGEVFLALQDRPRRYVALKAIRHGVINEKSRRRFEQEAEVLGKLIHPGIAQIYDADVVETRKGTQPYFALEYVEGKTLTEYTNENSLTVRQKLNLVAEICDAVQHAHLKGIIHRDLKPNNILVDSHGKPKILDFGIARATDSDIQLTTIQTDVGQLIGTLGYMSPEQAAADPSDLDTRSDVYSLGVCLYEVLTGRLPHEISGKMVHEALRMVREDDLTPLSSINPRLRGDVETITYKALERDRARRYQSASDLAEDIRRYLRDDVIAARPPSAMYQLSKFTRRHKALVAGVSIAIVSLLVGFISTASLYLSAQRANESEQEQRKAAQRQARIAEAVNEFLNDDLLAAMDPGLLRGNELTIRDLFDQASKNIDGAFDNEPLVEAAIRMTLGTANIHFSDREIALSHLTRAHELREQVLGASHEDTLQVRVEMDFAAIEGALFEDPEARANATFALCLASLGSSHPITTRSMTNVAYVYKNQGRLEDTVDQLLRTKVILEQELADDHPRYLLLLNDLGNAYIETQEFEKASELIQQTLNERQRSLGDDHPRTMESFSSMGNLLYRMGKRSEAADMFRSLADSRSRVLGPENQRTLSALNNLAVCLKHSGNMDEAIPIYKRVFELRRATLGLEHSQTLISMNNLAGIYRDTGDLDNAVPMFRETLAARRALLGNDHPDVILSLGNLAHALMITHQYAEALPFAREAREIANRILPEVHYIRITCHIHLGRSLTGIGEFAQAIAVYESIRPVAEDIQVTEIRRSVPFHTGYAEALVAMEDMPAAELHFLSAWEKIKQDKYTTPKRQRNLAAAIIKFYEDWNKPEQADEFRGELNSLDPVEPTG